MAVKRSFIALFAAVLSMTAAFFYPLPVASAQSGVSSWTVTPMGFTADEGQLLDTARDPLTGELWVSFMVNDPPGIAVCQQVGSGGSYGGGQWECNGPFPIGDRGSSPSSIDIYHTESEFRIGLVYLSQQRFVANEIVYRSRQCSLDESCLWSDAETIVRGETDLENPEYSNYQYLDAHLKFDQSGTPYVPFVTYSVIGEIEVASLAHPSAFAQSCVGTVSNWTCAFMAEMLGIQQVDIDISADNDLFLIHYGHFGWQYMQFVGSEQGNCGAARNFDCAGVNGFNGFFSLDVPSAAGEGFPNRFAYVTEGGLTLAAEQAGGNCGGEVWTEPGSFQCTELDTVGGGGEPFTDFTNNPYLTADQAGNPLIAYKDFDDAGSTGLKLAAPLEWWQSHGGGDGNCGGGQWGCQTVASEVDSEVAIEMDASGQPAVFFYDPASQSLNVARLTPPVPGQGEGGYVSYLPMLLR